MPDDKKEFYAEYDEDTDTADAEVSFLDSEREYPIEARCCVTGEEVKHSFCRYPDLEIGTMMLMSHEAMLRFSRKGRSLSEEFERVISLRRGQEDRNRESS